MSAGSSASSRANAPSSDPAFGSSPGPVTGLLRRASSGDHGAMDAVFQRLYRELKRLARQVRHGRAGETLSTTAVVHEAYLKLLPSNVDWESRAHFLGVAARAMRQVLVDAARARLRAKRGGDAKLVTFDEREHAAPVRAGELLDLDAALSRLAAQDERQARVVEYRYFAGLTAPETAEVLGVSEATVHREWRLARAWLRREMRGSSGASDGS